MTVQEMSATDRAYSAAWTAPATNSAMEEPS